MSAAEQVPPRAAESGHDYLSTSCHHGLHGYCQSGRGYDVDGVQFAKRPGVCKFCAATCQCGCHQAVGS